MLKTMKTRRAVMTALTACIAAVALTLAGCAGTPGTPQTPKSRTDLMDWKGAAFGTQVPEWVVAAQQSDLHIHELEEFQGQVCFVVSLEDPANKNKDFVVSWVGNSANGAAEVARIISTTVNNAAETQLTAKVGEDPAKRTSKEMTDSMSNASFKGFRKAGDFWALMRNRDTKDEYYAAYSLWVIPDDELNQQLAAQYQNIIDNNKTMSEAEREIYRELIRDVRQRGILKIK